LSTHRVYKLTPVKYTGVINFAGKFVHAAFSGKDKCAGMKILPGVKLQNNCILIISY
jgi:hypothetical protein